MKMRSFDHGPFITRKTALPNGLTVISVNTGSQFACVRVSLRAGSFHDECTGRGYLLEHLIGEGPARKHGVHPRMKPFFLTGIEEMASTGIAFVNYQVTCRAEYAYQILHALMDTVLNLDFGEQEFRDERDVVLEEIRRSWVPDEYLRRTSEVQYPSNAWLHHSAAWTQDVVENLSMADVIRLHGELYSAKNMVVTVSGGVEHDRAVDLLAGVSVPAHEVDVSVVSSPNLELCELTLASPRFDPRTCMYFRCPEDPSEVAVLGFVGSLLEDFTYGPLYKALRRDLPFVYGLGFALTDRIQSRVDIVVETDPQRFELVEDRARSAISAFLQGDWHPDLMEAVRNRELNQALSVDEALSSTASYSVRADFMETCWLEDEWFSVDDPELYRSITKEQVLEVANRWLDLESCGVVRSSY